MAHIENVHLLEGGFGYFPSFHDAEVLRIVLDREGPGILPTLEAQVHVFEMTSEVRDGKYVLRKHNRVTFRFFEIDNLKLEDFNQQNALQGLFIQDISPGLIDVSMDGVFGVDVHFRCASAEIVRVEPFFARDPT